MTANELYAMGTFFYSVRIFHHGEMIAEVTTIHEDEIAAQVNMWSWLENATIEIYKWNKDNAAKKIG